MFVKHLTFNKVKLSGLKNSKKLIQKVLVFQ